MELVNRFASQAKSFLGSSFVQAILYGSYARGDNRSDSDMDVMILTTKSSEEIGRIEDTILDMAYEFMYEDNVTISVNIQNVNHFEYWVDTLPYYSNIRKEGLVLAER